VGRKIGSLGIAKCWFFVSGKNKCDNTGRLKLPFFCAVGKIFKIIWVVLHVTKVRSVFFKEQRNCLSCFGRLLAVVSVVSRLLVTGRAWRSGGFSFADFQFGAQMFSINLMLN
jgi:tryptophan-rich sensory protein